MFCIIVWHDNGIPGSEGYTEYTLGEVEAKGGVDGIVNALTNEGIMVYHIETLEG